MKTTINESDFVNAFNNSQYKNNFSHEGLGALFDYLENYENECNENHEIDFDMIAIACDYSEYANLAEFYKEYAQYDYPSFNVLEEHTTVIYTREPQDPNAPFIIQCF